MKDRKKNAQRFVWGGTSPFFYHPFISYFTPDLKNKVILDCGCGKGINGYLIRSTRDLSGARMIGLDINGDYLEFCRKHNVYDEYIRHRLPGLPFKDKTVDFIICTEVIEHLSRSDGWKLLREIDRVCKGRALITTPNVFFQPEKNQDADSHHTLWTVGDFRKHGYKVYGVGARTVVVKDDSFFYIKQAFNYIMTPFSFVIPALGGFLLSVKDYE